MGKRPAPGWTTNGPRSQERASNVEKLASRVKTQVLEIVMGDGCLQGGLTAMSVRNWTHDQSEKRVIVVALTGDPPELCPRKGSGCHTSVKRSWIGAIFSKPIREGHLQTALQAPTLQSVSRSIGGQNLGLITAPDGVGSCCKGERVLPSSSRIRFTGQISR